jgi:hypothetical protein
MLEKLNLGELQSAQTPRSLLGSDGRASRRCAGAVDGRCAIDRGRWDFIRGLDGMSEISILVVGMAGGEWGSACIVCWA